MKQYLLLVDYPDDVAQEDKKTAIEQLNEIACDQKFHDVKVESFQVVRFENINRERVHILVSYTKYSEEWVGGSNWT